MARPRAALAARPRINRIADDHEHNSDVAQDESVNWHPSQNERIKPRGSERTKNSREQSKQRAITPSTDQ